VGFLPPVVGIGYMLSGTIVSAFAEEDLVVIREGEHFIDAAHLIHRVSRNGSANEPFRFIMPIS
jgi:hypothetical protein